MILQMILQMARFNRQLRPVNSIKHVVDIQGGQVAGTRTDNILIETVDAPVLANATNVETASRVNSIYLKVEAYATSTAALANFYMMILKSPANDIATFDPNVVGVSQKKKYVIHQEMVMMEKNTTGNPRTVFAGVISIPKLYRRNGLLDRLYCVILTPGVSSDFCIQCIYKEIR